MTARGISIQTGTKPRLVIGVLLSAITALLLLAFAPSAAADGTAVVGTLAGPDGAPLAGVSLTVEGPGFTEGAISGADGTFRIEVPKGGTYQLSVDETSLPAGISFSKPADQSRSILVLSGNKKVLFAFASGDSGAASSTSSFTWARISQLLMDGLFFGILIALGAVGLNLIFGTTGLTNFSHGELLTLGAFTAIVLNELGLNLIIAAPLAIVISAILWGWGQNKVLWKPLRRRKTGLIASMVVTIGLAITIRYVLLLFFGGSPRSYQQFAGQSGMEFGPVSVTPKSIVFAIWILGAGLAAFAGIYLGSTQDVTWNMGQRLLLVMFAAVTLGGLGTIYGAIVGALVVGMFVQLSTLFIPTEMKTVGALFLMIIILLVRPQGILGRRERVG